MRTAIAYCYPQVPPKHFDRMPAATRLDYHHMARRFVQAYMDHPTGLNDHELYVVINGGSPHSSIPAPRYDIFSPLVPNFLHHNNQAKDIGAYMMAARTVTCDFLVCIGAPVRPNLDGWLDRIITAVEDHGPGIYGTWGFQVPKVHISTTFFCIQPQLLMEYPMKVTDENRYEFEHGRRSITQWCLAEGFAARQVTRTGVYPPEQFRAIDPEDSLMLGQRSDVITKS